MAAWLNDWSAEFAAAASAGPAVGDLLPRAGGAGLRRRGARARRPDLQGARAGRRASTRATRCSTRSGAGWRRPARRWSSTAARGRCAASTPGRRRSPGCWSAIRGCSWSSPTSACRSTATFLDLAERYERVHLDTTMFATDFTERLMPFDRGRPAAAGRAAGQGAARQRLPVDPVPLRPPAAGAAPARTWGRTGCARCCGTTAPGCSGSRRDPEHPPDRRRPRHARPARAGALLPAAARLADPRRRARRGRPCGPPTAAPGCPSSWRPTTCRRCGRRSRRTQQMQLHLDIQVDDLAAADGDRGGGRRRQLGGYQPTRRGRAHLLDPAGHPFCLFVTT